jgi:hypothetical protein
MTDVIDAPPVLNHNHDQGGQHEFRDGHLGDPAQGGGPEEPGQGAGPTPAPQPADRPTRADEEFFAGYGDDPISPDGLALSFARGNSEIKGATWRYWVDNFLRFTGTHYVVATEAELKADLHNHIRHQLLVKRVRD